MTIPTLLLLLQHGVAEIALMRHRPDVACLVKSNVDLMWAIVTVSGLQLNQHWAKIPSHFLGLNGGGG